MHAILRAQNDIFHILLDNKPDLKVVSNVRAYLNATWEYNKIFFETFRMDGQLYFMQLVKGICNLLRHLLSKGVLYL